MKRYLDYKEKLFKDFMSYINQTKVNEEGSRLFKKDIMSKDEWNQEFDEYNKFNIDDNSDFDSDNEIDPLDHLITQIPSKADNNSKKVVTTDNILKKRKIKVSIIGRTNVGKSSIINTLLKESRVIVSEVSGTTRDCVPVEWIYKGRRVLLVDTAGLRAKTKLYTKIDRMISASTIKSIKFSHVVIYVIDSMEAFTPLDLVK